MPYDVGLQTVTELMFSVHEEEEFQSLILPYEASTNNIDLLLSVPNTTLLTAGTCVDDTSELQSSS